MIARLLQPGIQRQHDIVARCRLHPVAGLHHFTHIIHIHGFGSLFALQFHLHRGFNPGFAYGIIQIIGRVLRLQRLQLFLRHSSRVTDDLRVVDALIVFANRPLGDRHAVQTVRILHNDRHRLLWNVFRHRGSDISLVAVGAHSVADGNDLYHFFPRKAKPFHKAVRILIIRIIADTVPACPAQVFHHILGGGGFLPLLQIVYGRVAVNVRQKPQKLRALHVVHILSALVDLDVEIADHMVAVFFNHGNQSADGIVQLRIFSPSRLVHVLDGDGVRQLIVGKQIPVPVQNIASGGGKRPLLLNL